MKIVLNHFSLVWKVSNRFESIKKLEEFMKRKTSTKSIVVAVLAGIGAITAISFGVPMITGFMSIPYIIPVIVGVVLFFILKSLLSKRERSREVAFEGVTFGEIDTITNSGRKYSQEMRSAINRLGQSDVRSAVNDLCNISDSIMTMLKDDPRDLRIVKQFITYYLEPTHKIIIKYAELATARPMPADAVATLERTEKSLVNIRKTFLQQKDKMLQNDAMDLDTEIKVFENTAGIHTEKPEDKSKNQTYPN